MERQQLFLIIITLNKRNGGSSQNIVRLTYVVLLGDIAPYFVKAKEITDRSDSVILLIIMLLILQFPENYGEISWQQVPTIIIETDYWNDWWETYERSNSSAQLCSREKITIDENCLDEARDQDSKIRDQDQDNKNTVLTQSRYETVSRGFPSLLY